MPACPSRHESRSHTRAARAFCSSPLCEVDVFRARGCWGLTSWTCTRRARLSTTGGRADDVRPKRHRGSIDGRERQRRREGGNHNPSASSAEHDAPSRRSSPQRGLTAWSTPCPGRPTRRRERRGVDGQPGRFQHGSPVAVTAHEPDDVVDVIGNLTYRTDRAGLDAVRGRRLQAKPDLT